MIVSVRIWPGRGFGKAWLREKPRLWARREEGVSIPILREGPGRYAKKVDGIETAEIRRLEWVTHKGMLWMNVVDEGIMLFERRGEGFAGLRYGVSSNLVYAAQGYGQSARLGNAEHDARGLMIAIALCACCWLGLGYFLLT